MRTILFSLLCLSLQIAYGQPDPTEYQSSPLTHGKHPPQGSPVLIRPYPISYANNQFKIIIFVDLVYDMLQFTLKDEEYLASFDTEIIFLEKKSRQLYSKVWPSTFSVKDYELTNRRDRFFLTWDSLNIPPGEYEITFKYQDLQGKQKFQTKLNFSLPVAKDLYAPSPLFMADYREDEPVLPFLPARPLASWGQLPFNEKLKMLLNIHSTQDTLLQVLADIYEKNSSRQVFDLDTLLHLKKQNGLLLVDLPTQQWSEGKYDAKMVYRGRADSLIQQLPLELIWLEKPRSLRILEYAIPPLKIILPENEYNKLNSGSKEERHRKFEIFWQQKDPTPGTAFNEILFEFYNRVDSVDRVWGDKRTPGWNTDPGRIILMYGQPDEVEDNSLSPAKPHLRWTYYLEDRTLTFTFQALEGRKRYRLIEEEEN
jgi:GWxTD domain-containing protein